MTVCPSTESAAAPRSAGLYHGWLVVAAAFLIALFAWGIGFYGPGIYLIALRQRLGVSTAEISSAITMYYLLGATLILFAGTMFDRLGARRVVVTGAVVMACGVVGLAFVTQPWQVYPAFAVMSVGWATMSGAAVNIIVAPWFDRRRGLAVSFALNGASAGGVVVAPLLIVLIGRLDLALALSVVVGTMLAAGCILFGLGVGNLISLPGLIVQQEFPRQHFARTVSLIVAINQFSFAFGPSLLGYLQRVGGYPAALEACLAMQAVAAIIVVSPALARMITSRDRSVGKAGRSASRGGKRRAIGA